jgi:hypothetical protein
LVVVSGRFGTIAASLFDLGNYLKNSNSLQKTAKPGSKWPHIQIFGPKSRLERPKLFKSDLGSPLFAEKWRLRRDSGDF